MALAVAGLVADGETIVEDTACVATSFPQFAAMMNALAGTDAVTVENA
jgi:3-phosphoshikimate 1-carboxyvinyltransferase